MREIKFRAWDKSRKFMITSPKWVEFNVSINGVLTAKNYDRMQNEQMLEIMQYAGIKDKNGKEIFEGDIIRVEDIDDIKLEPDFNTVIEWSDEMANWKPNFSLTSKHYAIEVIGNIWETTELLETE